MGATAESRLYRGASLEARRAQRRQALIRAGVRVYGERGYRNATVRGVCEAAGLTERYFYESFPNSEALLVACFEAVNRRLLASMEAAGASCLSTPDDKVRAMLLAYYEVLQAHPNGARLFLVEISGIGAAVDAVLATALDRLGQALERVMNASASASGDLALLRAGVAGGVVHIALAWIASGYAEPVGAVAAQAQRLCRVLASSEGNRPSRARNS